MRRWPGSFSTSILPTYLTVLFAASPYLIVIRTLRVLRIFKVLKMFRYVGEANILFSALVNSGRKIVVFLFWVLNLTVISHPILRWVRPSPLWR